jgi:hypothetical protein
VSTLDGGRITSYEHLQAVKLLVSAAAYDAAHMKSRQIASTLWAMTRLLHYGVVVDMAAVRAVSTAATLSVREMDCMQVRLALFTTLFCSKKHGLIDDIQFGPCNQSDTPRE